MPMERRLTTIVAADVSGSSRLVALDEEGTLARFRHLRAEVIDPEIRASGGRLVKTMGDDLLGEARRRNPKLSAAGWRAAFRFPRFADLNRLVRPGMERLVSLGLPEA